MKCGGLLNRHGESRGGPRVDTIITEGANGDDVAPGLLRGRVAVDAEAKTLCGL